MSKWKKLLKWTGIVSVPALCTYAIFGAVVIPLVVFETGASKEYDSVAKARSEKHWMDNFAGNTSDILEKNYNWNDVQGIKFKVDGRDSTIFELADSNWANVNQDSDKLVIFSHGLNSTHQNAMETAFYWANMGYRVIAWDQRGGGENRDKHITFGYAEADDLNNLYNTVINNPTLLGKSKDVIMYGQSNGAATTLSFADRYQKSIENAYRDLGVKTRFIEESGYTSPKRQFETALNLHGILPAAVVPLTIPMYEVYADRNLSDKDADYLAQSDNIKQPLFIAHGDKDPIVDYKMGVELFNAMTNDQGRVKEEPKLDQTGIKLLPSKIIGSGLGHIGVSRDSKVNGKKIVNGETIYDSALQMKVVKYLQSLKSTTTVGEVKAAYTNLQTEFTTGDTPLAVRFFTEVYMWDRYGTVVSDEGGPFNDKLFK